MKRLGLAVALLALMFAVAPDALAGTCDITEYPASGTLTAERMNQRIRQTESCLNGRVGNANWASGEPLAVTNLQNQYAIFSTSWTIGDENGDATAGENVTIANDVRQWRVPVSATVIGMTVAARCPGTCGTPSGTVTLQKGAATIKTFTGIAPSTPSVDFAISNAIVNTDVLNIDVGGTLTGIEFLDITIYYKAQHQP